MNWFLNRVCDGKPAGVMESQLERGEGWGRQSGSDPCRADSYRMDEGDSARWAMYRANRNSPIRSKRAEKIGIRT